MKNDHDDDKAPSDEEGADVVSPPPQAPGEEESEHGDGVSPITSSATANAKEEADDDEEKGRVSAFMSNIRLLSPEKTQQLNDVINHTSAYADNPLTYSIGFILFLDFMERFAFNGAIFTMPGYLTGYYEPYWNPNYAPFEANSYIATFQGIGFVTPFIAAFVADCLVGDYWTINLFTGLCYIPGILLIAVSAIPHTEQKEDFPLEQLRLGTHILFPLGFGAAKTLYGVYAAKQFDPIKHSDQIEKFFVLFTGIEFIGSFVGALISIVISDTLKIEEGSRNGLVIAEFINSGAIILGLFVFLLGSARYVNGKLMRKTYVQMIRSFIEAMLCFGGNGKGCGSPGFAKTKESKGGRIPDAVVDGMLQIILLFPIFLLVLPINVAFTQAIVVNITTTSFMKGFGPFKAPLLVSTGFLFIGVWCILIKRFLSPFLQRKEIKLSIANRFALGSFSLGVGYAIAAILDSQVKRAYLSSGSQINIFWGLFGTFCTGGIAFHFAAMNEIAFVVAPAELKMLGTAVMLFMSQGIPNLIGAILFKACAPYWFRDSEGNKIRTIEQYVDAKSINFTYLMMALCFFNVLIMFVPPIKHWVRRVEEKSIANNAARAQSGVYGNVGDDGNLNE